MTASPIIRGFIAGFLAVLIFHQAAVLVLHLASLTPAAPWRLTPTWPLGVPAVLSAAFWGGLWGVAYALLEPRLTARLGWWPGGLAFGAVLPVLVLWFVVLPLKGQPVGGGFAPSGVLLAIVVHAAFGLGTALVFQSDLRLAGGRVPRSPAAPSDRPRG